MEELKEKENSGYTVYINGIPNLSSIPKETFEPLITKLLESIIKEFDEDK